MLQYLSHRFHCDGISFALPEGFYLNDATEDGIEKGLLLLSPDHAYRLDIGVEHCVFPSDRELHNLFECADYRIVTEIQPFTINGLTGHHAAYKRKGHQYYEARLDLYENEKGTVSLVFLVCTQGDILSIKELPDVIKAIDPKADP